MGDEESEAKIFLLVYFGKSQNFAVLLSLLKTETNEMSSTEHQGRNNFSLCLMMGDRALPKRCTARSKGLVRKKHKQWQSMSNIVLGYCKKKSSKIELGIIW